MGGGELCEGKVFMLWGLWPALGPGNIFDFTCFLIKVMHFEAMATSSSKGFQRLHLNSEKHELEKSGRGELGRRISNLGGFLNVAGAIGSLMVRQLFLTS